MAKISTKIDRYMEAYGGSTSPHIERVTRHFIGLNSGQILYIFQKALGLTLAREELEFLPIEAILKRTSRDQIEILANYFRNMTRNEREVLSALGRGVSAYETDEGRCHDLWEEDEPEEEFTLGSKLPEGGIVLGESKFSEELTLNDTVATFEGTISEAEYSETINESFIKWSSLEYGEFLTEPPDEPEDDV